MLCFHTLPYLFLLFYRRKELEYTAKGNYSAQTHTSRYVHTVSNVLLEYLILNLWLRHSGKCHLP